MGIHRLSSSELIERNQKIIKMAEAGCNYSDIGRRYGLATSSVLTLISRKFRGRGVMSKFGCNHGYELARFMDGIG